MEVRSYSGIERNEHNNIRNLEIIMFNEKKNRQECLRYESMYIKV